MAFRKAVQNRQRSKQELTEARQTAREEGQRADTAEMETLRIKIVSKIKEMASLNAKRIIDKTTSQLQEVVDELNKDLGSLDSEELRIGEKEYNIESVQDVLGLIQINIPTAAESAIRDTAIEKQAFDQAEKGKKTAEEKGWNGIMFPAELKDKIDGLKTKDNLETYLENLKDQKEFSDYQNKLDEKGISYFWKALLMDSLGLESTEIKNINKENCLKMIGQVIDAAERDEATVTLNFDDTGSDDDANTSTPVDKRGVGGAIDNMFG